MTTQTDFLTALDEPTLAADGIRRITVPWRRLSDGLWRTPEGDISKAYSASSLPNVRTFTHDGILYTSGGRTTRNLVMDEVSCYALIEEELYQGPDSAPYSYEGQTVKFRGKKYRLGPKVYFTAIDPTVAEWQRLIRVMYADGGHFASQQSYGEFLLSRALENGTPNYLIALEIEQQTGNPLHGLNKTEMREQIKDLKKI